MGIYSAQIQPNAAKLIGRRLIVQMDNGPKHTAKATQEFLKLKSGIFCNGQVNLLIISLAEDKTKGRKTHKHTTTEVSCSKGLAKHHKGGHPLLMSMISRLKAVIAWKRILNKILKMNILFMIICICPITFEP